MMTNSLHIDNLQFDLDHIRHAKIMVVGCGALGNEVIKNSTFAGIGHLALVDPDIVEHRNLSHSILFRKSDADNKAKKVDAAARSAKELSPSIEIDTIAGDICHDVGLGLIKQMDVVIGCVDNKYARFFINRLCMRAGKPWVDGGVFGLEGTVKVYMPGRNCYACGLDLQSLQELKGSMSCADIVERQVSTGHVSTSSIIASVIGAVQVQEALKLLHPRELADGTFVSLCGKIFYYEGMNLTSRIAEMRAYDEDCCEHEQWDEGEDLGIQATNTAAECMWIVNKKLENDCKILLPGRGFVSYIERKDTMEKAEVCCPSWQVEDKINSSAQFRKVPFWLLRQNEIHYLDTDFPYPNFELLRLGINHNDIIKVLTPEETIFVKVA
ncbi:MAG: ThiF family adenylyltransferase [Bacteroidales bacterium]|nr:ThiF family adenylyltransferase [Bacteroidales bacterium]